MEKNEVKNRDISEIISVFSIFGISKIRRKNQINYFEWNVSLKTELMIEPILAEFKLVVLEIYEFGNPDL